MSPRIDAAARIPILYLAPWVDYGGSDKGTIDWFRWIDRSQFAPFLLTTQPSPNRRLSEVVPFAEEVWALPDLIDGSEFRSFILDFIESRQIRLVHLMNSRLGFCLLPELALLEPRPAVVVQLHVEEPNRSGYVRYVTTRFGNLVDAFSVTSHHLARAVRGYGIARDRISVIHTGVDAESEFNPSRVLPRQLPERSSHILFPGRLTEQKDPLLMADIIAELVRRKRDVQTHVVGEGELEGELRQRAAALDLGDALRLHPPTRDLAPWYAACDAVLMTSRFEGVPYVAYEAMAMATPVVAPALAGNVELMGGGCGGLLVEDRTDVDAYVELLCCILDDPVEGRALGLRGRDRVLAELSLEQMGARHGALYRTLLQSLPDAPPAEQAAADDAPELSAAFRRRRSYGRPKVSTVVACFNHGRYLPASVGSILVQSYPDVETIVVDDGSVDAETVDALVDLERDARVTVVRLDRNGGPAKARNAGIELATGRYVLPVDADNVLLPNAIDELVTQIQCAGEQVGFIYPNMMYFGSLDLTVSVPAYNLWSLMGGNYCDTGSLFDREIFDRGFRFTEELRSGHEDWDFALKLAEHGIYGEAARTNTVLVRKQGFTRSDLINQDWRESRRQIQRHRAALYRRREAIKAVWSPELSLIQLGEVCWRDPAGGRLARRLHAQAALDFELIAPAPDAPPALQGPPRIRRVPAGLAETGSAAIVSASFKLARGRCVLLVDADIEPLLDDRAFVAKLLIAFRSNARLEALVLAASSASAVGFELLDHGTGPHEPLAVAWRTDRQGALPDPILLRAGDCVGSIVRAFTRSDAAMEWRAAPGRVREPQRASHPSETMQVRLLAPPAAEGQTWDRIECIGQQGDRGPLPGMTFLCRHRQVNGDIRVVTSEQDAPEGFEPETTIGLVHGFSPPGTRWLALGADGRVRVVPRGRGAPLRKGDRLLGAVEELPFLLQDPLQIGALRTTGHHVLVNGVDDPLLPEVDILETVGFIEPWPLRPRRGASASPPYGLVGLVRGIDRNRRRHVYSVGSLPAGELVEELGALHLEAQSDSVPVWVTDDGRIGTENYDPSSEPAPLFGAVRWALAPGRWWGLHRLLPRARAVGRRTLQIGRYTRSRRAGWRPSGPPAGYLFREDGRSRLPLYAALHPITGDQLLTRFPVEAQDLGYTAIERLGYLLAVRPVTGSDDRTRPTVPWASRFGLEARWQ